MLKNVEPFGFLDSELNFIAPKKYTIWGGLKDVTFTLSGYEIGDITNAQKQNYNKFISNSSEYIKMVEMALFNYYTLNRDKIYHDLPDDIMVPYIQETSDLRKVFDWNQVYLSNEGIVFMFEASFEPELGIGVLIADGCVKDIDFQEYFI